MRAVQATPRRPGHVAAFCLLLASLPLAAEHEIFRDGFDNPATPTFLAPFGAATTPASAMLDFDSRPLVAEAYIGIDTTGSMASELGTLRTNLASVVSEITCASSGLRCHVDGDCASGEACLDGGYCRADPVANRCLPLVRTGVGTWNDLNTYRNLASIQTSATTVQAAIPASASGGSAEAPFQPPHCVASPAQCAAIANIGCAGTGAGCPGYGGTALRMYLQLTDADQQCSGPACANYTATSAGAALRTQGIGFAGLWAGENDAGGIGTALGVAQSIGIAAGSLDASNNPFTFSALDAAAATAARDAIRALAYDRIVRLSLRIDDLPGDAVDVRSFFVRAEAVSIDTAECDATASPPLDLEPGGGDGVPDTFEATLGARLCWRLDPVPSNTQVGALPGGAVYYGRATLIADGVIPLDSRIVSVVVPQ